MTLCTTQSIIFSLFEQNAMVWFQLYIEIVLWDFWTYYKSWRPVSLVLSVVLLSTTLSFVHHARCDFKISYHASCKTLRDEPSLQTFLFRHFFTKIRKIFTVCRKTRKLSKIRKTYAKNVRLDRYVVSTSGSACDLVHTLSCSFIFHSIPGICMVL